MGPTGAMKPIKIMGRLLTITHNRANLSGWIRLDQVGSGWIRSDKVGFWLGRPGGEKRERFWTV